MLNERSSSALLPVYAQLPVHPVRGQGSWLFDENGQRWLDAYGGHAVASTGHCHPKVVQAISAQAAQLLFYSTALPHPGRERLAEAIVSHCPSALRRVFLVNSGAEANENALHLARKITGRQQFVSIEGGWHGRTAATLAVTDGEKYMAGARRAGIPLSVKVPWNNPDALKQAVSESIAGVILEPVQGLTGARDLPPALLQAARQACDKHGALLIFDEVQCGVGRCGAFTAAESFGVTPDVLTLAKGLASGLPISAVVTTDAVAQHIKQGDLGSTFGGGPVPCAAALATLQVIDEERLIENAMAVGDFLAKGALSLGQDKVVATQGRGLLLGLRLAKPAAQVQHALLAHHIVSGTSSDPQVLRLMPPLTFSKSEAELVLSALSEVL
ncbi:MAG TPA: aminotransferase class III-fold pyridoxal phosphate-dependent enzyme [Pseudomonadota bacterium]|nr:aminotransferase class III-fold pyridoxal phosphate-dependent enzyme [Pseudomonadota bacterium]HNN50624.1 aminotransferase class III-fold pyridoxal phosphate-dependent enzyme [Pseudomonadota bacterium]